MTETTRNLVPDDEFPIGSPVNISRRHFLLTSAGAAAGAFVLGFGVPVGQARAQQAASPMPPGTRVPAFLEIRPDSSIRFMSPFVEGGQGVFTAMAQIVGEELDADPKTFVVENAPAGGDYLVINGKMRITGGSMSGRTSYETMRKLGPLARNMLLQAAAKRLNAPITELTTEPGRVIHAASGRSLAYGEVAAEALDLPVPAPESVSLRDPSKFRWIGKPVERLDMHDKSTGKAVYAIDCKVDGMLHAAVQHAPRLGLTIGKIRNEEQLKAMPGVHSVHSLSGAVAVVAERWWNAKRAAEAAQVDWREPGSDADPALRHMPADFSTAAFSDKLANEPGSGKEAENVGDVTKAFDAAKTVVSATYKSQYLHHAQLEPPSTLARFNPDGSLEVWLPNQAPEQFQADIAKLTGLDPSKVTLHSPILGGFFGRHFLYPSANPYPQAIQLAKEVGRPVKLIWSREEEFLRDPMRPMAAVRFRGALDASGMHRIAQIYVKNPTTLAYWRSVGNSMNDFFYETFLDELADKGGQDPYELRMKLLQKNERLSNLLKAVGDLSGGWKRGPFTADDGSKRARGVAMASPFGSHTAAIAEVSIRNGQVVVHDVWEAIDPGSIVNPAIIEAQINSATALGMSQVLMEEAVYQNGEPTARNYDLYPILPPDRMARVHVRIIESGAEMGGIGEPGLPAIPPAVANAVSTLTGKRIRSMPLSNYTFES